MKRIITAISLTLAIVLATACLSFAAACTQNKGDGLTEYTVTVLYPDGAPVKGSDVGGDTYAKVSVQFCDAADENGKCYTPIALTEDGKAVVAASKLDSALNNCKKITVHVLGLPDGYTCTGDYFVTPTSHTLTIKLSAN